MQSALGMAAAQHRLGFQAPVVQHVKQGLGLGKRGQRFFIVELRFSRSPSAKATLAWPMESAADTKNALASENTSRARSPWPTI